MKNIDIDKELSDSLNSITASTSSHAPDRPRFLKDEEKPAPRPNKPEMYIVMQNEEMLNAYGTAAEALVYLTQGATVDGDTKAWIRDAEGNELASKAVVDVDNTTNPLAATHKEIRLQLSDDMLHDIASEGIYFDPDNANSVQEQIDSKLDAKANQETAISEPAWKTALNEWDQANPQSSDRENVEFKSDAITALENVTKQFNEIKQSLIEQHSLPEWNQALIDAQSDKAAMSVQEDVANFVTTTSPDWKTALKEATAPNLADSGKEQSPGIPSPNTETGEGQSISESIPLTGNSPELLAANAAANLAALREHFQKIEVLKDQDAAEVSSRTYEPQ